MSFSSTTKSPPGSLHDGITTISPPILSSDHLAPTTEVVEEAPASEPSKRKPLAFWMVFVALCFSCFVAGTLSISREHRRLSLTPDLYAALDLTAVSTTLPDGRFRAVLYGRLILPC
jgi:hypothetical protein